MTLPILPAIAIADLRAAKSLKKPVFFKEAKPVSGGCANCGGIGSLWFQFGVSGPMRNPPGDTKRVSTYTPEGWWIVESKVYDCPVCQDHSLRLRYLQANNGLEANEQDWTLDFISKKRGKEQVYNRSVEVISSQRPTGFVTLHGGYGVGKSGTMKAITAMLSKVGVSCRYTTSANILLEIRDTYGDSANVDESELFSRYGKYQVLCVDEVDRVSTTAWAQSTLMTLLDTRYTRRGQYLTILATNVQPDRLPPHFGYLASRMKDGDIIQVGGEELRG